MKRRTLVAVVAAAAGLAGLPGCSSGSTATTRAAGDPSPSGPEAGAMAVVASTDVWGAIASAVGGDHVDVTSIITNPDADPHDYQASARNQLATADARVVIKNGGGYDDFMDRLLASAPNDPVVLDAVSISGRKGHADREMNAHVWYDFGTVLKVADRLADAFTRVDPAHAAAFRAHAEAFTRKVEALERRAADLKLDHAGQPVAITESVPLYLLDAIGLVNRTPAAFSEAVEEDRDAPAKVLYETLQLYDNHRVRLLVYNVQTTGPQTLEVLAAARKNHIPAVPVTETLPNGEDYLGWMSANLSAIAAALGRGR